MLDDARKFWLAMGGCLLLAGFAVYRYKSSFGSGPPASFRTQQHNSQSMPKAAWRQVSRLLDMMRAKAQVGQTKDWSLWLLELSSDTNEVVFWGGDMIRNEGFDSETNVDRELWLGHSRLLGMYAEDGNPLAFRTQVRPPLTNQTFATVYFADPIPPGGSTLLIERRLVPGWRGWIRVNALGERTINLGRMRANQNGLEVWALLLPPRARLVRSTPPEMTTVFPGSPALVGWVSSELDTDSMRSITFTMP
jgi:hypothetical protein